jgi:hypothetical protein
VKREEKAAGQREKEAEGKRKRPKSLGTQSASLMHLYHESLRSQPKRLEREFDGRAEKMETSAL